MRDGRKQVPRIYVKRAAERQQLLTQASGLSFSESNQMRSGSVCRVTMSGESGAAERCGESDCGLD